jgi:hypothetical protein
MTRSLSELTKNFAVERRNRIDRRKSEILSARTSFLSPLARDIVQAAHQVDWVNRRAIAAVLRATVDQVCQEPSEKPNTQYDVGFNDAISWIHERFFAIADELEGLKND